MDGPHLKISLSVLKTVNSDQVKAAIIAEMYFLSLRVLEWRSHWETLLGFLLADLEEVCKKVWDEAVKCGSNPDYPGSGVSVLCVQMKIPNPPRAWKGTVSWEQAVNV